MNRAARRCSRALLATAVSLLLALTLLGTGSPSYAASSSAAASSAAADPNPVTPGNFTGRGFDQCLAPEQGKMDRWLESSPFLAVGIYISGTSRACRSQPNLSGAWVRSQLRKGWKLLPITLGPQASCATRFPRYSDDRLISARPGKQGRYPFAKQMGRTEAATSVADAKRLGLRPGSTLWYDLEAYDLGNRSCRESALSFLSGWTTRLHELGWVSGVYSSAGSGIKALDDARVSRPKAFDLPDAIWVARWDGVANTSTSYIREDGWRPGGRVKQYLGGHNETHGGVTINIDSNFLDLGRGSVGGSDPHCGGVRVSFTAYPTLRRPRAGRTPSVAHTKALQCLLTERNAYTGKITGTWTSATTAAVSSWRERRGMGSAPIAGRKVWMSALAAGPRPVLKTGSSGPAVRRLQRALNASKSTTTIGVGGVVDSSTRSALTTWQRRAGVPATGIATSDDWKALVRGVR